VSQVTFENEDALGSPMHTYNNINNNINSIIPPYGQQHQQQQ
jgi:hypothetical protein